MNLNKIIACQYYVLFLGNNNCLSFSQELGFDAFIRSAPSLTPSAGWAAAASAAPPTPGEMPCSNRQGRRRGAISPDPPVFVHEGKCYTREWLEAREIGRPNVN